MTTAIGNIAEELLEKQVSDEPVPCGRCITTSYFLDGELVRRDVEVQVDPRKIMGMGSQTGEF
jgi:hypothetical protein